MKYRPLGSTGTQVSELCIGAMTFGEADEKSFMHKLGSSEEESFAVLDRALAAGINFVDTADVYGQDGLSERVLGRWLASRKSREKIVLATKGRFRMSEGPNGTGASRMRILRAIDDSLTRLGTDRIDLYQIHMQDLRTPEDELLRALDDAVRAGKIVYLGCSNYAAYRLVESLWVADKRNLSRFVTLQAQYSLAVRDIEREHVPLCVRHGLGILPWSPLAGGLLSGKYRRNQPPPQGARLDRAKDRFKSFDNERTWKLIDALLEVSAEIERSPSQVALAWLLTRPAISSVIFGARTVGQLDDNLAASELELPASAVERLDAASAFPLGYPYEFIKNIDKRW
jgi:aryl-alcohol dehydrogenase-like predicted oxidoreductase